MDSEMEYKPSVSNSDTSLDLEWQVDSEWISLSISSTSSPSKNKKGKMSSKSHSAIPQNFHFVPNSQGGRFLVVENQALRLNRGSASGASYWVCSIPCCNVRCVLDPTDNITRYAGEHNHEADISKTEYRNFINSLKHSVKENPQVRPKDLYDTEVSRSKDLWKLSHRSEGNEDELFLPSFDAVKMAMYNTRNAVLSSAPPKQSGSSSSNDTTTTPGGKADHSREPKSAVKRKATSSKDDSVEFEDMGEPDRDANLSDFEEWLDGDSSPTDSSHNDHMATSKRDVFYPPPDDEDQSMDGMDDSSMDRSMDHSSSKKMKVEAEFSYDVPSTVSEEGDQSSSWSSNHGDMETDPTDPTGRRKYRKRPASSSVFTCPYCPYKSNRHFNVQRHERLAHSTKKPEFSCKECGTSYSLEYRLKLHIKAVHQGEGHHCHICNRTFETMTGLKSHVVTKHKGGDPKVKVAQEPPPELTCQLCGRFFSTKSHLAKHTSTHVMVQPYRCYMCNKAFIEESQWLGHQAQCCEPFTIQCCLCSAILPTPQSLLTHMDKIHGRSEYSCTCGKSFPWKKSLLTHQQKCALRIGDRDRAG